MLQYLNQKRGQSTLEYAVLIVVIIGALLTIQTYIKRGVQGRLKQASDDIGDQYSPDNTNMIKKTVRTGETYELFNGYTGSSTTIAPAGESTNTTENAVILNTQTEYWGS